MPDPIRIEEAFQETTEAIETAQSFRYILSRFFAFIALIEGEYIKYQSYLHQLLSELPIFTLPVTWSGIDPEKLRSDANLLEKISSEIETDSYDEVIQRLREISFLQFICVCEPEKADQVFEKMTGALLLIGKSGNFKGTTCSNLSCVQQTIRDFSESSELSQSSQKTVDRLLKDILRMLSRDENTMLIPVVEENSSNTVQNHQYRFGRLRKITLRESGESSARDSIIRHYPVVGAEPVSNLENPAITSWGRKKAEEKNPVLKNRFYNTRLHFEINSAGHLGESASMAVSAMWYTFLLEKGDLRGRYTLAGDAAMTGDVNENGVILPVDPDGFERKTEAVFFSWANLFAVPAVQLQEFDRCLKKLKLSYPDRNLTLIGIENLDGIFYDRRLSDYILESRFKHTLKKFKKEKFKVVGIPVIVILLLVIARLMHGPIDRNPVEIEYSGSSMILKNSVGSVVKTIESDPSTVSYQEISFQKGIFPLSQLIDINGDGINDLIYVNRADYDRNDVPMLKAYSIQNDSLLWEKILTFNYDYPRQSAQFESAIRVNEIGVLRNNGTPKLIVNAVSRMYFYSIMFGIDLLTGEVEKEYIHPGRIDDIIITDFVGDGSDEILFSGVNNAYWNGFFSSMNYDSMNGYASAATIDYTPNIPEKAKEEMYMLFPKTLVANFFKPVYKYNNARRINFDPTNDLVLVIVQEGQQRFINNEIPIQLIFYIDNDFRVNGIGTYDSYDIFVRDLYEKSEIPFLPNYDYFESLQDSIQYWNGEQFVYTREYFKEQFE